MEEVHSKAAAIRVGMLKSDRAWMPLGYHPTAGVKSVKVQWKTAHALMRNSHQCNCKLPGIATRPENGKWFNQVRPMTYSTIARRNGNGGAKQALRVAPPHKKFVGAISKKNPNIEPSGQASDPSQGDVPDGGRQAKPLGSVKETCRLLYNIVGEDAVDDSAFRGALNAASRSMPQEHDGARSAEEQLVISHNLMHQNGPAGGPNLAIKFLPVESCSRFH